jgi:HK97 family phage major capsid protein
LNRLAALAYATDELLSDAPAMSAIFGQAFAEELGFELDEAIVRGDGVSKPLGILNSACTVSLTGESSAKVKAADIIGMRARLWARSRANSVWLINQDTEPSLHKMFVAGLNSDQHVYTPANGLSGLPYDTLYGRPVVPIEQASSVGTVGDIILADLSQYGMIRRDGAGLESSMHVRFINHEMAFRISIRVDGKPLWLSAITPARGSNTQSPFITIATR